MYLRIRSRNRTAHQFLERKISLPCRGVYRCGSTTPLNQIFSLEQINSSTPIIEINSIEGVKFSSDKILMKQQFDDYGVKTAKWYVPGADMSGDIHTPTAPFIIKRKNSSGGDRIYYAENDEQLVQTLREFGSDVTNYIVEHYYTFSREYRLHVDKFGCFCAHRKMLRNDATERWHRHHSNCVWIREDNEMFNKPNNWDDIVNAAQLARRSCHLDICSVDIKVSLTGDYIVLETNSASALGEETAAKYIEELKKIAESKLNGEVEDFSNGGSVQLTPEEQQAVSTVQSQANETPDVVTAEERIAECERVSPRQCPEFQLGMNWGICRQSNLLCKFINLNEPITFAEIEDDDEDDDDEEEDFD